jgi:hypothetical protein
VFVPRQGSEDVREISKRSLERIRVLCDLYASVGERTKDAGGQDEQKDGFERDASHAVASHLFVESRVSFCFRLRKTVKLGDSTIASIGVKIESDATSVSNKNRSDFLVS